MRKVQLDDGGNAGGAGRLGDLQPARKGRPPGVLLALGMEEEPGVGEPGLGMVD
jgi:hypothetical protein